MRNPLLSHDLLQQTRRQFFSSGRNLLGGAALLLLLRRERDGGDTRMPIMVLMGCAVVLIALIITFPEIAVWLPFLTP